MPNRLINETSPYLLQHARNPVDWYPWGDEAFDRAAREDRPILLSIGYSACHWCHVMEQESFENMDTARIMNQSFVNIKVDREERPDIDAIYMEAVQAMTGGGGWPLTVFLTPDRRPFYGGTYFPPEDRQGMPGFPRVLETVLQAYRTRKGQVESAANDVVSHLSRSQEAIRSIEPLTSDILRIACSQLVSQFDRENGGLGAAPKFPQPMILEFLLRCHERTGDSEVLRLVELTLDRMAKGGICDQLGGGFHRYSVDARWLVPHFEKMLYDNALLARLYLHAYQVTGKELYRRVVEDTLDYVLREMRSEEGGFYSSQDADSEGVEGKYYVWTIDEIREALTEEDARLAIKYFGISEGGNFEGANILSQAAETGELASELGLTVSQVDTALAGAKAGLLEARSRRAAPGRDTKVLTDWNGLMLSALAEAAGALERDDYLQAAIANAAFLTGTLEDGGSLAHSRNNGRGKIAGYLLDHALLADGLLSLYEATFDERWLRTAKELGAAMVGQFWDEARGSFYDTGPGHESLIIRPRSIFDNALPSGPSAAAASLLRLARLTDNGEYERIAAAAIRSAKDLMARYPSGLGHWLCALELYLSKPERIAVIGAPQDPETRALLRVINRRYLPNRVLAGRSPDSTGQAAELSLLEGRDMIDGRPAAYVCEGHVCRAPATDPAVLDDLLARKHS